MATARAPSRWRYRATWKVWKISKSSTRIRLVISWIIKSNGPRDGITFLTRCRIRKFSGSAFWTRSWLCSSSAAWSRWFSCVRYTKIWPNITAHRMATMSRRSSAGNSSTATCSDHPPNKTYWPFSSAMVYKSALWLLLLYVILHLIVYLTHFSHTILSWTHKLDIDFTFFPLFRALLLD